MLPVSGNCCASTFHGCASQPQTIRKKPNTIAVLFDAGMQNVYVGRINPQSRMQARSHACVHVFEVHNTTTLHNPIAHLCTRGVHPPNCTQRGRRAPLHGGVHPTLLLSNSHTHSRQGGLCPAGALSKGRKRAHCSTTHLCLWLSHPGRAAA